MRLLSFALSLLVPSIVTAQSSSSDSDSPTTDSTTISIQPVTLSPSAPAPLAKIAYNPSTLTSSILSYYAPELSSSDSDSSSSSSLLRIGIYDTRSQTWKSSTSVTSTESFAKGYAPTFVVTLDEQGAVLGVSVKSARIDAGQTRDFGPKVLVRATGRGKGPVLNRPVVLNPEGKVEEPAVEKTLLQKYWWVGLGVVMMLAASGGE